MALPRFYNKNRTQQSIDRNAGKIQPAKNNQ